MLILDDTRWSRAIKLLEVVFAVALIVKLGDFHKPAPSRLSDKPCFYHYRYHYHSDHARLHYRPLRFNATYQN